MSWFSVPREYRRFADGRVEIIERRSFLRIGLAVLGVVAVGVGSAAVVMTKAPMGGETAGELNRHPELTKDIAVRILREQDRDAVYRILTRYEVLDVVERNLFWNLVLAFDLKDLKPFAESALRRETVPSVRDGIDIYLRAH